jgi:hypothetical protein
VIVLWAFALAQPVSRLKEGKILQEERQEAFEDVLIHGLDLQWFLVLQ